MGIIHPYQISAKPLAPGGAPGEDRGMDRAQNPGRAPSLPEAPRPLLRWIRANRVPLLFALVMLLMVPMRDLWAPDEPDFAQCVREMRERGSWLLPYLNGQPYSEKPILFYWLMKGSAIGFDRLTGGAGFVNGISAWALRLPSALAASPSCSASAPGRPGSWSATWPSWRPWSWPRVSIWVWQAQAIQIDMVFAALLAGSWLAWLGGYLLLRGPPGRPLEERRFFLGSYAALALAFLAKGPLALALTGPLWLAFLAWQRDLGALGVRAGQGLLLGAAHHPALVRGRGRRGGPAYAYEMVVHQNLERALHAWDHIQPPWKYVEYLAGDFFPWTLLLPALALFLRRVRRAPPALAAS